ncbi:divergent polysaccharide deacetylase family protein [Kaarinaea lacus]
MNKDWRTFFRYCFTAYLIALFYAPLCALAEIQRGADIPAIAIIIDDLGNGYQRDKRAVLLPGKLSYAFLPHTPYTEALANLAHSLQKDVLLHLPMQSTEGEPLGPGALTLDMSAPKLLQTFLTSLASVPHAVGINNHMGSLLTQHPGHMQWLMQAIASTGNLFFVDSFTASKSIAYKIAAENRIPNIKRDVFLDSVREPTAIRREFYRMLSIARKNGIALAIGHPYPETLQALETLLPTLPEQGIRLVPVSQLIKLDIQRIRTWRAYSSH